MKHREILKQIRIIVENTCKAKTNYYGYGIWTHHIRHVVTYAKQLADGTGADKEIVEIAALLHDYASVKDKKIYKDHHIHGAKLAEEILKKYKCPKEKIEKVKECILSHRASKKRKRLTKEARCIADADAMAHFNAIASLFYLAFKSHKMEIDEANEWLMKKLEQGWKKLSPAAKKIIKDKYKASKILLR